MDTIQKRTNSIRTALTVDTTVVIGFDDQWRAFGDLDQEE